MKKVLTALAVAAAAMTSISARAVDGCTVLLCLAGPWPAIPKCVPPVEQFFKDMALGKPFPACMFENLDGSKSDSSDSGSSAVNTNITIETCPPMYDVCDTQHHTVIGCRFQGVISIQINNEPWSDTYWSQEGDQDATTSTHYYSPYLAQMPADTVDPTWDNDLAAYNRTHRGQDNPCGGVGN